MLHCTQTPSWGVDEKITMTALSHVAYCCSGG